MVPSDEQQFAAIGGQPWRGVEIMALVQKGRLAAIESNGGQGVFRFCNGRLVRFLAGFRIHGLFALRMDLGHGD